MRSFRVGRELILRRASRLVVGLVGSCLVFGCSGGQPAPEARPPAPTIDEPASSPSEPATEQAPPAEPPEPATPNDPLPDASAHLALGGSFGCVADASGEVRCFGSNQFGQRGAAPALRATPTATVLGEARRVVAGTWHLCLLAEDTTLRCLGHGGRGQLGDGGADDRVSAAPVMEASGGAPLGQVVGACAGEGHTCARHADRRVTCWGANDRGQLGDGTFEDRRLPTAVAIDDVVELACGRAHTCARRADGEVHCWGENVDAQLGDGSRSEPEGRRASPAAVVASGRPLVADRVFAGPGATCAILRASEANDAAPSSPVSAGSAADLEPRVWCWGRNDSFQLGVAPGGGQADALVTPHALPDTERAVEVAIGARHTCVRDVEGGVACVGANRLGQLGDGTRHARRTLVPVTLSGPARTIAAGVDHTCALLESGTFCWGADREGQLGRRARGRERWSTTPVLVE